MFKKVTLTVVRVGNKGEFKDSAPCVDCTKVLKNLNIKKIIYSNQKGELTSCKMCKYQTNHISTGRKNLTQID